jgi:hypothetical protein
VTYQIGSYTFLNLRGNVPPLAQTLEIIQRPGIDSVSLRKLGNQCRVFALESLVNLATYLDCRNAIESYKLLIGGGGQTLIVNGLNYSSVGTGFNVVVLAVEPVEEQRKTLFCGGFIGVGYGSFACRAQWNLMLVPIA